MVKVTYIYALCEPGTEVIRYIGKSDAPVVRLRSHMRVSVKHQTHLGNWLRSLGGILPSLMVLAQTPAASWPQVEIEHIKAAKERGCNLVNTSVGGEGVTQTPEVRAKISASRIGIRPTAETLAKLRAAKLGTKLSAEHRSRIGAAQTGHTRNLGKRHTPETRRRMSENRKGLFNSFFGQQHSDSAKAKMRQKKLGIRWSTARRAACKATV